MSRIYVNYGAVSGQTTSSRSIVSSRQDEAVAAYSSIQSSLASKDGAANAGYIEAAVQNKRVASSACKVMLKLLNFISGSAEQMRIEDARLSALMRVNKNQNNMVSK